nr:MAG TPA: hypothetical protein [Bacteriophage sp.]
MNKTKYEFKNELITINNNVIKIEMLSGYPSSYELKINNKELIPSIQQWMYNNANVHKFINIKYINERGCWYFNCEYKTYVCFSEDLSLLNLNI